MYDFLLSEEFWMEIIIGAVIGAIATIIAAALVYNIKVTKMQDGIKSINAYEDESRRNHIKTHELNSETQKLIVDKSIKTHELICEKNNDMQKLVSDKVGEISTALKLQEQDRVNKYENLTEKQKDISDSLKMLNAIQREIETVNLVNKELNDKVSILTSEIKEIKGKNVGLEMDLKIKTSEYDSLKKELEDTKRALDKEREGKPKERQR